MGSQKIYSWTPRSGELKLIHQNDGVGTIYSVEFDHYANNLYWINPNHTIMVMNLDTGRRANIFNGNTTYKPVAFTLFSKGG